MRALQTLSILGLSPVLQCSACRNVPLFSQQDLRPQCPTSFGPFSGVSKRFHGPASLTRSSSTANAIPSFSYRIAASFSGKGRRFNPKSDTYSYSYDQGLLEGPFTGRPTSGQDAFFISGLGNSSNTAFGVADGVGGWSDSGFDSAHFSHGLCQEMTQSAVTMGEAEAQKLGPRELLNNAYKAVVAGGKIEGGGSTACVAVGRVDGSLTVAKWDAHA